MKNAISDVPAITSRWNLLGSSVFMPSIHFNPETIIQSHGSRVIFVFLHLANRLIHSWGIFLGPVLVRSGRNLRKGGVGAEPQGDPAEKSANYWNSPFARPRAFGAATHGKSEPMDSNFARSHLCAGHRTELRRLPQREAKSARQWPSSHPNVGSTFGFFRN